MSSVDPLNINSTESDSSEEEYWILETMPTNLRIGKDGYVLPADVSGASSSGNDLAEESVRLYLNGYSEHYEYGFPVDASDASSLGHDSTEESVRLYLNGYSENHEYASNAGISGINSSKETSDSNIPPDHTATSGCTESVQPVLGTSVLAVLDVLSCISMMYASKDVVLEALIGMGYTPDDLDSVGQDEESLSQLFINIAAHGVLWGIPMITILANSVMRLFTAIKSKDFLKNIVKQNLLKEYLWLILYAALALPPAISDTLINVLTSQTLKDKWLPMFIIGEAVLSLAFLIPQNLYFIHLLRQRLECAWDKYVNGIDRKLLSKRLEVLFYELRNVLPEKQAEKLQELYGNGNTSSINGDSLPSTYEELIALSPERLQQLTEAIFKNNPFPDGSSAGSTLATGITIVLALAGGAATMRSPREFYKGSWGFPTAVAWGLSSISGVVKFASYFGSFDSIMWYAKNYSRLFGSAPILYGVGAGLMVLSGAGFWEVGELALAAVFKKIAEDPTWWFYLVNTMIYSNACAANINGAAGLASEKGEEMRQNKLGLDEHPDLAMGFKKLAGEALNPPKKSVADEEGLQGTVENGSYRAEASAVPATETTPLSGESSRECGWDTISNFCIADFEEQERERTRSAYTQSISSCCTFFYTRVSDMVPRSASELVRRMAGPCFN